MEYTVSEISDTLIAFESLEISETSENQDSSSISYSDSGYESEHESQITETELEDFIEEPVQYVNGSILEEYSEEDPCLLCGKGPFCELEYHLIPFCGCGKAWYHPACTVKCMRIACGQAYFLPLVCPYCNPKKAK